MLWWNRLSDWFYICLYSTEHIQRLVSYNDEIGAFIIARGSLPQASHDASWYSWTSFSVVGAMKSLELLHYCSMRPNGASDLQVFKKLKALPSASWFTSCVGSPALYRLACCLLRALQWSRPIKSHCCSCFVLPLCRHCFLLRLSCPSYWFLSWDLL